MGSAAQCFVDATILRGMLCPPMIPGITNIHIASLFPPDYKNETESEVAAISKKAREEAERAKCLLAGA